MTQFEELKKVEKLIGENNKLIETSKDIIRHLEFVKRDLWIGGRSDYSSSELKYHVKFVKKEVESVLDNLICEEKRNIDSLETANYNIKLKFS